MNKHVKKFEITQQEIDLIWEFLPYKTNIKGIRPNKISVEMKKYAHADKQQEIINLIISSKIENFKQEYKNTNENMENIIIKNIESQADNSLLITIEYDLIAINETDANKHDNAHQDAAHKA